MRAKSAYSWIGVVPESMSVQLRDAEPLETRITRDDISGALSSFLRVVL